MEIEADKIETIAMIMFKYMPANVEIVSPEKITLSNLSWGEVLSELIRKLHAYDEVARVIQVEKAILEKKLAALEAENDGTEKRQKESKKRARKQKRG